MALNKLKTNVGKVLALLDAGKAVRIAEQEAADVPINDPPMPTDPKRIADWETKVRMHATWRANTQRALADACDTYTRALTDIIGEQFEGFVDDHVDEYHGRRIPVGDD